MVSDAIITPGTVVKIHNWHGVVLETHHDEQGQLSIIRVQTVRNIFRGYGPEYIDIRMLPDAIEVATVDAMQKEIETHRRLLDSAIERMFESVQSQEEVPIIVG